MPKRSPIRQPSPRDARPVSPRRDLAPYVLLLIVAVAGTLRFYDINSHGLWQDEFYSLASSAGRYPDLSPLRFNEVLTGVPAPTSIETARPWQDIWRQLRDPSGTHPPLYILVLRAWRQTIGAGDAAGRALSAVCSLAALLLMYDTGRRLYGAAAAFWSAALMAVAWPQVHYAQDLRPYAFLIALGMAAMNLLVRIEQAGRRDASGGSLSPEALGKDPNSESQVSVSRSQILPHILLALALLAMALTHYLCIGALLAVGVYVLLRFRGALLRRTLITLAASAALFVLLWGPALWSQRHSTDHSFLRNAATRPLLATLSRLDQLPLRYFIDIDPPNAWHIPLLGTATLLALLYVTLARRRELLLPLLWLALTAGAVAALDLVRGTQHLHFMRYTVLASPALYLLVPAALPRVRPWVGHTCSALLVGACLAALPTYYATDRESWRGMGTYLASRARPDQPLVFAGPSDWYAQSLCIAALHYAHDPRRPVLILDRAATPRLVRALTLGQPTTAWLIVGHAFGQEVPPEEVQRLVPGGRIRSVQRFSTAQVFELLVIPAPLPP